MASATFLQKEDLAAFLSPLTDLASKMILAGTLKKNVVIHFTNKGLSFEAADNITEVGCFKAEQLQKNKAK